MKRIALPLSLLIIFCWALLQPAEILSFSAPFMPMRRAFTLLLGALALGWMSYSMLLALRPPWLERYLGGLDKLFGVHKWVGIGSVLLVVAHWLLILSPRTLVAWGWIEPMMRRRQHGGGGGSSLIGMAKDMGEWAAWLMIILGIISLLRFIPYGWFRKLHKGFPVAFLLGAYHSVVLLPEGSVNTLFGALVLSLSVVGSFIALFSLAGLVGRQSKFIGRISQVNITPSDVLDVHVTPDPDWPGHKAGQFALLTLDKSEGAHPFTIVSAWHKDADLRFAIKPLGDYTRSLAGRLKAGMPVSVEGPYGSFDFGNEDSSQLWVAGGIGIAPFVARLEELAARGGAKCKVHFFYCLRTLAETAFPEGLAELCRNAGVELHMHVDALDGRLSSAKIGQFLSRNTHVWFCGAADWARTLQADLQKHGGLQPGRFHREVFEFR